MEIEKEINKDLILREKLAVQRTIMANQTTFLSFLRTAMYFLVAGLTLQNIFTMTPTRFLEIAFFIISAVLFIIGVVNYFIQRKKIEESKIHIGDYKLEYLKKNNPD